VRDAIAAGELRAAPLVPAEQLDHAGRLAERVDPLVQPVDDRRVEEPDATADRERVRGAPHVARPRVDPAEAELELVDEERRGHRRLLSRRRLPRGTQSTQSRNRHTPNFSIRSIAGKAGGSSLWLRALARET
jgi:hypothetical protein